MLNPHGNDPDPLRTNPDDKWLRIIGLPVSVLPFVYFYVREYGFSWSLVLLTFSWGMVSTGSAWIMLRWWVFRIRALYYHKNQTKRRVLLTFGGYIFLIILVQPLETWGLSQIAPKGLVGTPEYPRVYLIHIGMALAFVIIVGAYYEITYYLHLYRLALTEAEAIRKAQVQRQLDNLKSQVNPHFLFNSLNSLSSLVHEDAQQANRFLDELATVYRYLLQANQKQVVSLQTELDFMRSYMYLLQTRYANALHWTLAVDEQTEDRYLPPLTLQLLVENAIRHNVIDAAQPLQIRIDISDDSLAVVNSIQRKSRRVKIQQGGLTKLTDQFSALGLQRPRITDDGQLFRVEVPLILSAAEHTVSLP